MEKIIKVDGMHCKSCEFLITDSLNDLKVKATAYHKTNTIKVNFDEKKISLDKIKKSIESNGYKVK